MKALCIDAYGGPEQVRLRDLPVPAPGTGEVRVRLAAAGINFMDIHTCQGKYASSRTYPQRLPTTLGIEGAGRIDAVGEGVTEFRLGQRVAWCLVWGSYAEYAIVPAARLVALPDAIAEETAVAVLFHGLTAQYLIHDTARLAPGMVALVLAASGGIGQMLLALGSRAGARMLGVTSDPAKAALARARGAAEVFLYENGGFAAAARAATGGRGVDVVFDPIGAPSLRDSFRAARRQGLIIAFGSVGGSVRDLDPIELGEAGSLFLTRPRLADHIADSATLRRRAADIFAAIADGTLQVEIAGRYRLEQVAEAHAALEGRRLVGKPVLVF